MTEKSEFREMRSFDLAIRRAYFKAQIRRNYAKNVVINRSEKALKIFFSRTRRPMILKFGMQHQAMELYKVCINRDPGMTLTFFTARST